MFSQVLILAAGKGERLLPLTYEIPKAMIKVHNKELIAFSLDQIKKTTLNISATIGENSDLLINYFVKNNVRNIVNTAGHGNSWWIFNSLMRYVDEPILVLPCDIITKINFDWLMDQYKNANCPPCMLVPVVPINGIEGDFIFESLGQVLKLSRTVESPHYCSGIQILNPKKINDLIFEEEDFQKVWLSLIAENKLFCSANYQENWFTINTISQLNHYNLKTTLV